MKKLLLSLIAVTLSWSVTAQADIGNEYENGKDKLQSCIYHKYEVQADGSGFWLPAPSGYILHFDKIVFSIIND